MLQIVLGNINFVVFYVAPGMKYFFFEICVTERKTKRLKLYIINLIFS